MAAFWRHQVVAALGVVVVLARLTDEDVVAGRDLRRVVEERRTVIALQEVLTGPAFDPVVAAVAEHGVGALTGDDEVVAGAGEGLVVVGAAVHEVLTVATDDDVVAGACVEGVVAGAALEHVGAIQVGDDVVAVATEGDVVAAVALDDVGAVATPEGVVVVAAGDAVDAGGAVVDGLAVDAARVDGVALPVRDRAVGHAHEQQALVAVGRRRVVGDDEPVQGVAGRRAVEVGELELAVGRREGVGLERVGAVGVALDQLGERVALELGAQVQARRAGQVVEPVAVLQLLELVLEHVVERACPAGRRRGW